MKRNKPFLICAFLVIFIFMVVTPMVSSPSVADKMPLNDFGPVETQVLAADGDLWLTGWDFRQMLK